MEDILSRLWENLIGRVDRPMALRFVVQPAMAIFFGVRDGLRFAREGRSLLFWSELEDPAERRAQFLATCRSIGKVFVLALILDAVYQGMTVGWFYPLEALIVAIVVALVPYFAVRGSVNWLASRKQRPRPPDGKK
jgi:hypothetical protein